MRPRVELSGLRKNKPREIAVRFLFGGAVSVAAWALDRWLGPVFGGAMLAFPAVLPATLTLVSDHDGRKKATDDARGASLGAVGLLAFALMMTAIAEPAEPWIALAVATIGWAVASSLAFALRYGPVQE